MNKQSQTDWDRIDALKDEEIDYSEIPDLGEDEAFWSRAEVVVPVTIWVDPEVLAWFKAQGEGYEERISKALQTYKETHEK
ncbi:MAG: BrnA antitoxin family protein [Deltaproteobacteria bacterium]|nr:BrnA antitoxin family protein [Deltaproteobacteria bacterium]